MGRGGGGGRGGRGKGREGRGECVWGVETVGWVGMV